MATPSPTDVSLSGGLSDDGSDTGDSLEEDDGTMGWTLHGRVSCCRVAWAGGAPLHRSVPARLRRRLAPELLEAVLREVEQSILQPWHLSLGGLLLGVVVVVSIVLWSTGDLSLNSNKINTLADAVMNSLVVVLLAPLMVSMYVGSMPIPLSYVSHGRTAHRLVGVGQTVDVGGAVLWRYAAPVALTLTVLDPVERRCIVVPATEPTWWNKSWWPGEMAGTVRVSLPAEVRAGVPEDRLARLLEDVNLSAKLVRALLVICMIPWILFVESVVWIIHAAIMYFTGVEIVSEGVWSGIAVAVILFPYVATLVIFLGTPRSIRTFRSTYDRWDIAEPGITARVATWRYKNFFGVHAYLFVAFPAPDGAGGDDDVPVDV